MNDYTTTPNYGLYKPTVDADEDLWGTHLNANADVLDTTLKSISASVPTGGPFLPLGGGTLTGPLNYTATGGTTPRSAQDRAGSFLTPEDFGAVGNGVTDDSAAFNAYADYIRATTGYQPQRTLLLSANRTYVVRSPLNFNLFQPYRVTVIGNGSSIVGGVGASKAIISAMASNIEFQDLRIVSQGPVLYGVQAGVRSTAASDDQPFRMDNVEIIGQCVNSALYLRGTEGTLLADCNFTTQTAGSYALITDACAHWAIDSTTITDTRPPDAVVSFNEITVINARLINGASSGFSPVIWIGGGIGRHRYIASYAQVQGTSNPIVVIYSAFANALNCLTWDVHSEFAPSSQFFITGPYATPVISDLQYSDHLNQVAASRPVFVLDTPITSCTLRNLEYRSPNYLNSNVTLFDQPAKYTVSGKVAVPSAAIFNNPAAFSGELLVGDTLTINSQLRPTINAQTIATVTGNAITVPAGTNYVIVQDSANAVNSLTVGTGALADGYDLWMSFPNGGTFSGQVLSAHGNLTLKTLGGGWSILSKFG